MVQQPAAAMDWHQQSNHLIFLSVQDLPALISLHEKLLQADLICAAFYEPDIGDALTAVAVAPSPKVRKYCGGLPLCLREYAAPSPHLPGSNIPSTSLIQKT